MNLSQLAKEVTLCRKHKLKESLIKAIKEYAEQESSVITKPSETELIKFVESHFNLSTGEFMRALRHKF